MWRRPQQLLRQMTRHHARLFNVARLTMVFFAAFGGAYGFISGSRSPQSGYDPHAFSIGVSFLFALSCVALATLTLRNRLLSRAMQKITLQNQSLAERNAKLSAALNRSHRMFGLQNGARLETHNPIVPQKPQSRALSA